MKIVYNAANSLEAHMIRGLLEQQNIPAYVHGEHLQSGIGEIPAIGLVNVNVDDENYQAAKTVIQNWGKEENNTHTATPILPVKDKVNSQSYPSLLVLMTSFLCGAVVMYLYLHSTPLSQNGIDYNRDGKNDEVWTYQNRIIVKTESDSNFDGKVDSITSYDNGLTKSQNTDENFDGTFEAEYSYENGRIYFFKSDTNNDGKIDITIEYVANEPKYKTTIFNPKNNLPKKIQYYEMSKLKSAEFDSNDDGDMDTLITYDFFEDGLNRKSK
jgi:hypothetical protein